jgi:mRNA-degrading endonuclease RelE of RelBE toxin-antitoxin system
MTRIQADPVFQKRLARLQDRFPLLKGDFNALVTALESGNLLGDKIPNTGYEVYKVRLPNRSARKGKSGGFRVVYYVKTSDLIGMLSIYNKSEQSDVPIREIIALVESFLSNRPDE